MLEKSNIRTTVKRRKLKCNLSLVYNGLEQIKTINKTYQQGRLFTTTCAVSFSFVPSITGGTIGKDTHPSINAGGGGESILNLPTTLTELKPITNPATVPFDRFDLSSTQTLYFLGGFVEGEGSNSVAISIGADFKYGVNIQPIFNVTQHENGLEILNAYKKLFGAGSIAKKSGSPHVWVYTIKGYKNMISLIIPFLEKYVQPYSCKRKEYEIFKEICIKTEAGGQKTKDSLIDLVKLAYTYKGKGKERIRSLEQVIKIIEDKASSKVPSETTR
jgi:hypothetical protein